MGIEDVDKLTADVERQISHAIDAASVLIFLVDVRTGPVPLDEEVAMRLRGVDKPVLLVANKCDAPKFDDQVGEFYKWGFGEVICVSAKQDRGREQLLEAIEQQLPPETADEKPQADAAIKLAIVGKRNTGKSTFINCLAQGERTIVSDVAGTTRDSIDVRFNKNGQTVLAIDTAGVRTRGSIKTDVDFYSLARAERSIRRADVVLHFLDASKDFSMVDKQLAGYILENYKPAIFVANKWDLLKGKIVTSEFSDYVRQVFPSLDFMPMAFITAKDGKNVQQVLDLAQNLHKQAGARVSTGMLNRVIQKAYADQPPSIVSNRQGKIYFAALVSERPPTIVLFTNGPQLFDHTYIRYLTRVLRDSLPFKDVPIKLYLRNKRRDDAESDKPKAAGQSRTRPRSRKKTKEAGELWSV
jgi:GTP-binding protein